ncbi:MAG: glycosyltransferase family 39 protein [Bacteroidota bacterium]
MFSLPSPVRMWERVVIALAVLPFLLRIMLVWVDFEQLLEIPGLLENDCFYYMNIAANVAQGRGWTADGETPTNGFHALHQVLCTGCSFVFGGGSAGALRALLSIQVAVSFVCMLLLAQICRRSCGRSECLLASFLFAWWLPLLKFGNNGLETVLQLLCLLLVFSSFMRFNDSFTPRDGRILGFLAGASVLARVDMLALVAGLVLTLVIRGRRTPQHARAFSTALRWTAASAVCAVALAASLNLATGGSVLPDGGIAAVVGAPLQPGAISGPAGNVLTAVQAVFAVCLSHPFAQLLAPFGLPDPLAVFLAGSLVLLSLIGGLSFRVPSPGGFHYFILLGAFYGIALLSFYVGVLPAVWAFDRYLLPLGAVLLVVAVPAIRRLLGLVVDRARVAGGLIVLGLGIWYASPFLARWADWTAERADVATAGEDAGFSAGGVCSYHDLGMWMRGHLDPRARVAMWEGAQVAFLAPQRILHLEGAVNRPALHAWKGGRLEEYLRAQAVDYVVDTEPRMALIRSLLRHPEETLVLLESSPCGPRGLPLSLYRLRR